MQEPMPDILTRAGLGTLATAVRRRLKLVVASRLAPYDLTLQQFWVILVLLEKGSCSLHPLAHLVWMDDPTASRVVKAMVELGLLHTKPDPKHGRRILISLPIILGVTIIVFLLASLMPGDAVLAMLSTDSPT